MQKKIQKIYYIFILTVILLPLKSVFAVSGIRNPIGSKISSIEQFVNEILKIVIALGTPVAVLFLVYSGFKFVVAQGNTEKLKEARQFFTWTLVGIVILLGAQVLSTVIAGTIKQLGVGL